MVVRERSKQDTVDEAEYRAVGANAECEGQDGHNREARASTQSAERMTRVLDELAVHQSPRSFRRLLGGIRCGRYSLETGGRLGGELKWTCSVDTTALADGAGCRTLCCPAFKDAGFFFATENTITQRRDADQAFRICILRRLNNVESTRDRAPLHKWRYLLRTGWKE